MRSIGLGDGEISPGKIICVGKNYKAHIEEMGGAGISSEPTLFLKPSSSLASGVSVVDIPEALGLLHHEVELCFVIGRTGKNIKMADANSYISGYGVGIDFTLRDRQTAAKKAGLPWSLAKGFDCAAVFGEFLPVALSGDPLNVNIELSINGELKQNSNTRLMIFSPPEIVSFASRFMTIEEGDIFMTGTPEGVGPVKDGDRLTASIEGIPTLEFCINR